MDRTDHVQTEAGLKCAACTEEARMLVETLIKIQANNER
jgi:hypothetical protein